MNTLCNAVHHGRNVKRFREMLGMKQDFLAKRLEISQQMLSDLETNDRLENDLLVKIAEVLNIPVDILKNFKDELDVNIISSTFDNSVLNAVNQNCTFNPLDKVIELYERIVKEKEKQISSLEQHLNGKK